MIRPSRPASLAAIGAALLALAGCQQAEGPSAQASSAAPVSGPDAKPGLALTAGRLVLPAVRGNPGAAYFTLTNGSDKPAVIAAVDVAGAGMAMFHQTQQADGHSTMAEMSAPEVKPGAALTLGPGGGHVMVGDLPASLKPGGTVEITLTFADGDKLSAPLTVEIPGGAN